MIWSGALFSVRYLAGPRLDRRTLRGEFLAWSSNLCLRPCPCPWRTEEPYIWATTAWLAGQLLVGSDERMWTREQLKLVAVYYCIVLFIFYLKKKTVRSYCMPVPYQNRITWPNRRGNHWTESMLASWRTILQPERKYVRLCRPKPRSDDCLYM